jgi:cell division septum initiation protein DivIVA
MSESTKNVPGFKRPEFTTGLRGYDRLQVDDYIEQLHGLVTEAEERARAAEEDLEYSQHTATGPRISEILELAVEEARELRERAAADSAQTLGTAHAEAEQLVGAARTKAAEVEAQIEHDREQAVREIAARHAQAESRLNELAGRKASLLADLNHLREALAAAVALADQPLTGDGSDTDSLDTEETPLAEIEPRDDEAAAA